MKRRYVELDFVRAVGILWIVGFWHLSDYTGYTIRGFFASFFTNCIMAAFFFLSGLLLNGHKQLRSNVEKKEYVIKRFFGFLVPFVISVATLIPFSWFDNSIQILLTITGVSAFFPPMAGTLWFSSILVTYYLFGFIFLSIRNKTIKKEVSILLIGLCFILIVFKEYTYNIEQRFITYAPVYIIALNIQPEKLLQVKRRGRLLIGCICIITVLISFIWQNEIFLRTIGYLSFVFFLILIFIQLKEIIDHYKVNKVLSIINRIGIASSFAFFFHRQYFIIIRAVIKRLFGTNVIPIWFAYVIALPLLFIICYCLQVLYSRLYQKAINKFR